MLTARPKSGKMVRWAMPTPLFCRRFATLIRRELIQCVSRPMTRSESDWVTGSDR